MKIAIISINNPSLQSAKMLSGYLDNVVIYNKAINQDNYIIYDKLDDILYNVWNEYDAIIFLLATGIVVRKIAPLLNSKAKDPAILVMNMELTQVIPLLSGHIGGANELANMLCNKIDNLVSFTTTATDQTKTFAFDMFAKEQNFDILNLDKLANISNSLINKEKIYLISYKAIFDIISNHNLYTDLIEFVDIANMNDIDSKNIVYVTPQYINTTHLLLKPKDIYLGIGTNRGVSMQDIENSINRFLFEHNLEFKQIKNIASFRAKNDEVGLLEFAKKYNFDIKFFDEDDINNISCNLSPSRAKDFFGIKGVAEPSCILVSKYNELFLNKRIYKDITIAGAI